MSNPYDTASERVSVLGPTLRFKGELSADEDLVVHGRIEGTLGPAPRVTIGPEAKVEADVHAGVVIVEGTVHGNLKAQAAVVVRESATLAGDIEAPSVSILEGARFDGHVAMGGARSATRTGGAREAEASARTGTLP